MVALETGWDVVLLVDDDEASDERRGALEDVPFGRAGGIFAPVADAHVESAEATVAPISFDRDEVEISVSLDDTLAVAVEGARGFNDELGTITLRPLTAEDELSIERLLRGCRWALFAVMVVVGSMNILWMAVITVVPSVERAVGWGDRLPKGVGVASGVGGSVRVLIAVL